MDVPNMTAEGPVYTQGNSFRARAEAAARNYRASVLNLAEWGEYGHFLTEADAAKGFNFLPSLRDEILAAVKKRDAQGKGVHLDRTTRNMLSSQAMCFNLFVPLSLDKAFAAKCLNSEFGDVAVVDDISIEYTPSKEIFNDQSGKGGVDCDVLIKYQNGKGSKGLFVIETKYVELEFSDCSYRDAKHEHFCPEDTIVSDFSECNYHSRRKYRYWDVALESGIFDMDGIQSEPCPFGGPLWQLWTNQALAFALSNQFGYQDYKYLVIYPEGNEKLTRKGEVFRDFSSQLIQKDRFRPVTLEELVGCLKRESEGTGNEVWVREFGERYFFA